MVCAAAAVVDILAAMNVLMDSTTQTAHHGGGTPCFALAVCGTSLCSLTLMTDRAAARPEGIRAGQALRLAEQSKPAAAAARMAKGDLVSKSLFPAGNELTPLALRWTMRGIFSERSRSRTEQPGPFAV